jgi:hypothetical protein
MAAGPRLDGAGNVKMKVLDDAILLLQRVNGLVENYAMAVKRNTPASMFLMNIRRTLPTLAENLKSQFGLISDQILAVNLASSRGASEAVRVRVLREGVAQVKQALEIAVAHTKDKHAIADDADQKGGAESS